PVNKELDRSDVGRGGGGELRQTGDSRGWRRVYKGNGWHDGAVTGRCCLGWKRGGSGTRKRDRWDHGGGEIGCKWGRGRREGRSLITPLVRAIDGNVGTGAGVPIAVFRPARCEISPDIVGSRDVAATGIVDIVDDEVVIATAGNRMTGQVIAENTIV